MKDMFFDLNDVLGDNVKIHLRFEDQRHTRLPDYGPCDIYLHLKTHEETINETLFQELSDVHKTLSDKKSKRSIPVNKFKMTVVSAVDINDDKNTELYIRRIRTRKGELPRSTKDLEVLTFDFVLDLLERLLDHIQEHYLIEEETEFNFEEERIPQRMPAIDPIIANTEEQYDINTYTGKMTTGVVFDDEDDVNGQNDFFNSEKVSTKPEKQDFFADEGQQDNDFFGDDNEGEIGERNLGFDNSAEEFYTSSKGGDFDYQNEVVKDMPAFDAEEDQKEDNAFGEDFETVRAHELTQEEMGAIGDRLSQHNFGSNLDSNLEDENYDIPMDDPDNPSTPKEKGEKSSFANPFDTNDDDDEKEFWN